ncbi:MAG: hypothetical protein JNL36_09300 [Candidatus Kapabacteria bacterium]|nr:hypothetical protein [Candidatus Kapabacteria bacterium]
MPTETEYNSALHHRRSIRLPEYDYSQVGMYFVTICCQDMVCRFGSVVGGKIVLNECGRIAKECWEMTPLIRENIDLGAFVIMPNHMHGIIHINGRGVLHTPNLENDSEHLDVKDNEGVFNTPLQSPKQKLGSIVRGYKSAVTKKSLQIGVSGKLWQRNYYEHVIRNEYSYQRISEYIFNNPAQWEYDTLYRL